MSTFRYVVGVLLVIGLPPGLAYWFVVHPFVGFWRRLGPRVSMGVLLPLLVVGVAALFPVRDALLGRDLGLWWPAFWTGIALTGVAAAMAVARRKLLTMRVLSGLPELQADGRGGRLLDEGPYARLRHPRYVEVAVACFAYAFLSNHVGAYAVALLSLPVLHGIVLLEERELAARFGRTWSAYAARVPRYVPLRRGEGTPPEVP